MRPRRLVIRITETDPANQIIKCGVAKTLSSDIEAHPSSTTDTPTTQHEMASRTLVVDQFKLDVIFHDDTVTHTGLLAGPRANATWKRGTKIGSGGFGVVWIEKKVGSGELRAVKVIPRRALSQELQTLVRLQDVPHSLLHNLYLHN